MADYTKNLVLRITGDSQSAQTALSQFEASLARSQQATHNLGAKIAADWKAFEDQAAKSAASIDRIGQSGGTSRLNDALSSRLAATNPTAAGLLDASQVSASTAAIAGGMAIAGAAVVKFGSDAVESFRSAADAVDKFQDVSGASAQESSKFVAASQLLGVSTDALGTSMGRLLKGANANEEAFKQYGVQIVRTKDGAVDAVATFENVARAFARTEDPAKRAELGALAFGRGWQQIVDVLERGGGQLDAVFQRAADHAPILSQDELDKAVEFNIQMGQIRGEIEKLKVSIGGSIVGDLSRDVSTLQAIYDRLRDIQNVVPGGGGGIAQIGDGMLKMLPGVGIVIQAADAAKDLAGAVQDSGHKSTQAGQVFGGFSGVLSGTRTAADDAGVAAVNLSNFLNGLGGSALNAASGVSTLSQYLKIGQADWAAYTDTVRTVQTVSSGYEAALDDLDAVQTKSASTASNSAQTIADSAQRVADAQRNLADANEQAQQRIIDVNEQAAQRIVDAQQRVIDAQDRANETAEDGARRVGDARQRLADAINQSLRDANPYDANRRVEEARQNLSRTEEDEAKKQAKAAKDVQKAQKDLADTETQAAKDRAKAQVDASKQIEQATRQLEDAQKQATRATEGAGAATQITGGKMRDAAEKAQTLVDRTYDLGYQTLLMGGSMDTVQPKIDAARQKIDDLAASGQLSWERVAELHRQLDAIPNEIHKNLYVHMDAAQFKLEIDRIMTDAFREWADPRNPMSALIRAGVESAQFSSGGGFIPAFADGGIVPGPVGKATLAIVHGGEAVVPPGSEIVGGGGGTTMVFNNYAPIFSEHDFAEFVQRAIDKGYAGIRS